MTLLGRQPVATWKARASAPFRLIGRRPWASSAIAGVLLLAGGWIWWATQLWGLPDIGDPFDVAAFRAVQVPKDRNSFFDYRDAAAKVAKARRAMGNRAPSWVKFTFEWSKADQAWRDLTIQARAALDAWRSGSEKPDYLDEHSGKMSMKTLLPVTQELNVLGRMAILEGSRLEDSGDVIGAWGWYRAALRASRHPGHHGFMVERLCGAAIHDQASQALTRWASNPLVDAELLRRALGEVIATDAMTVPLSETVKVNYVLLVGSMDDPDLIDDLLVSNIDDEESDWCQKLPIPAAYKKPIQFARVIAADDRERSLRVTRLMTANWLAQVDKLTSRRAPMIRTDPPIYEAGPGIPAPLKAEKLANWLDSSMFASRFFRAYQKYATNLDRERPRQARLVVHLADQFYRREHGGPPPSPAALVGPYLKVLPEGYDEKP